MKKEDFIKLGFSEEDATKAAEASQEELKGFIPKARFDEVNTEKKNLETTKTTLEGQLETLKNSTGDVEGMKTQIATLQADNATKDKEHAAELKKLKRDAIDESILMESKAKDPKLVKVLFDPIDDSVDEESYKALRNEQVKKLVEAEDKKYLFNTETKPGKGFKGVKPGEKKDGVAGDEKPATLADAIRMRFEESE